MVASNPSLPTEKCGIDSYLDHLITGLVSRAGNPKAHGAEVQILSGNGSFNAEIFHVKIYGGHMVLCGFY